MLLFDGLIWTDDGGLGKLSMHPNEDVEDKVVADVISSAMIDEGDDCDDFWPWEERVGVYRDRELSASGHQESKAISCVHFAM